jgi:hypothetical protein
MLSDPSLPIVPEFLYGSCVLFDGTARVLVGKSEVLYKSATRWTDFLAI